MKQLFQPLIKKLIEENLSKMTFEHEFDASVDLLDKQSNPVEDVFTHISKEAMLAVDKSEPLKLMLRSEEAPLTVTHYEFSPSMYYGYTLTLYGYLDEVWYGSGAYSTKKEGSGLRLAMLSIPMRTMKYSKLTAMPKGVYHK